MQTIEYSIFNKYKAGVCKNPEIVEWLRMDIDEKLDITQKVIKKLRKLEIQPENSESLANINLELDKYLRKEALLIQVLKGLKKACYSHSENVYENYFAEELKELI